MQSIVDRRLLKHFVLSQDTACTVTKQGWAKRKGNTASASLRHRRTQRCSNECYHSFDTGNTAGKQAMLRAYGSEFVEVQETVAIFVGLLHSTPQLRAATVP
jgi:hypothetical protein